ncbi:MAG: hypothetical protein II086_03325 [Ruminococcus sp.]|nr:hypothetical protein [Ruminococcus sp.]SCX01580.1 hypothetical protein SAMN02910436_00172 [Ruminococcaceae bacterium P7]
MMKNKLFGRNIVPDCSYCNNSYFENGRMNCRKGRQIQDAKCKAFDYDPLLRVPRSITLRGTFSPEDFKL